MPPKKAAAAEQGETQLWAIVERVNAVAKGDLDASIEAFRAELAALDDPTLLVVTAAFSAAMRRAYDRRLWQAAYVIHGGCGDDAFWDFRAGLVALGGDVFGAALRDPDSLAEIHDIEDRTLFEGFQYVPNQIIEARGLSDADHEQTPDEPSGPPWNADQGPKPGDLKRVYPRLCARFHWID